MRAGKAMILFGLFWSGMTLLFDGFIVVPTIRQLHALRFPATEGRILSAEVREHDGEDGPTYSVEMEYVYTVDGREYSGTRYRYQRGSTSGSGWAHRAVAAHPPGSKTQVYYNPRNPRDSLLSPGVSGMDLFLAAFMLPFNAVMLGFWGAGWGRLRRRLFKPVAGGVRIVSHLKKTRVRLINFSPVLTGLATMAGIAFASVFIVGFLSGFHPSVRTMTITWGVILTGGVAGFSWQWYLVLTGKYDLILDEREGRLELPLTHGRKTRAPIPFAKVQSVFVDIIEKPSNDGGQSSPMYAPTVRVGEGAGVAEKLVDWHDGEKAAEFVEWLNEKLPPRKSRPVGEDWLSKRV